MLSNLNEKKTERKGRECPLRADAAVRHAGQLPTTRSLSFLCLILGLITYPSSRAEENKSPPGTEPVSCVLPDSSPEQTLLQGGAQRAS